MRMIDADKIQKAIYAEEDNLTGSGMCEVEMEIYNDGIDAQWEKIEKAPTIDAVEVVRCRDCIHCADDYVDTGFGAMPTFTCDIFEGYGVGIKPDHYCSYGERGDAE